MTPDQFRKLALSFPDTSEQSHMGHPDFRAREKIFATLGYPDEHWGMVKLSPEQQREFVAGEPKIFVPVKGEWGRRGCTNVHLHSASKNAVELALETAWQNVSIKAKTRRTE
jgi:hypothetical protein